MDSSFLSIYIYNLVYIMSQEIAAMPQNIFNRGNREEKVNVMNEIHSLKVYNPAPGGKADPELAGKLMIKPIGWESYVKFVGNVSINILKVRKGINGSFILLDENGEQMTDGSWNEKRWFAYTNEYGRFTSNITEVFFKAPHIKWFSKITLWDLKNNIKMPTLPNGKPNPFHRLQLDQKSKPYDSSWLSESYIIYWTFNDGIYAWEEFRLFMSSSAFGAKYDATTKTQTIVEWSLADALNKAQKLFKDLRDNGTITNGSYDDSYFDMDMWVIQEWSFFKPTFTNVRIVSRDNTENFQRIDDLLERYNAQEFSNPNQTTTEWFALQNPTTTQNQFYKPSSEQLTSNEVEVEVVAKTEIWEKFKWASTKAADQSISIEDIPF